jgi:16S rRNA (cytosine967-C5)-methyltransferase
MTRSESTARGLNARGLALEILLECREHTAFVQELLDRHLNRSGLSAADRRLTTQLTYGVLRRRGTLDALLRPCVARRRDQVEAWLWESLRLGAYQLALLSHIPAHAAIYETVELAGVMGRPQAKGFLNGVLRSVAALLTEELTDQPAADALPVEQRRYRKLTRAIFADPSGGAKPQAAGNAPLTPDPSPLSTGERGERRPLLRANRAEYLAAGFSWPRWLAQRWLERYGWEECVRLGFWFAGAAPLWLRINPLRTDRDAVLAAFAEAGVRVEPGEHPQSVRLLDHVPIPTLPGYERGWFAVQDHSSMQVGSALAPEPGSTVLDLCAAPGGKTTHLAELMHNQGKIIACDVDEKRLQTLTDFCHRMGVSIVEPCWLKPRGTKGRLPFSADAEDPPTGPFDAALVDVPCSNTGVLGRRPEVRWRLKPEDFRHLVPLQTKLLLQAAERVQPGGVIVYSTCSIEPEENQGVVQAVLRALPELRLEAERSQIPGQPADGGYCARLRRRGM